MHGTESRRTSRVSCFTRVILLSLFIQSSLAHAQAPAPSVSLTGLPATPLIGEQFCVDASFSNTAAATGFGPYLIAVVDPGIRQISVDFVDIAPRLDKIGDFDASGQLTDPISGLVLNGVEGGSAWLARYPVGSVDQGNPALVMTVCAAVEAGSEINVPINVAVTPGFEFGDTTVGTNGPVVGGAVSSTVTPQLARVSKTNSAPESERPPGPSHPFQYTWSVDVSEGVSIENLEATDVLPAQLQWTEAPVAVTAPTGVGCTVLSEPNPQPTPGGTVSVRCDSLLGNAGDGELTVSIPVFITDILPSATPGSEAITNRVDIAYDFQGTAFLDDDSSTVTAKHAAIQKSVSGTGLPGGRLTYSINFQITDYPDALAGVNQFLISDIIPDGLRYDTTLALVINGSSLPISPTVTAGPGPGETTLIWDVAAAAGGTIPGGARGSLTFETTILDSYANGDPVQAADVFTNTPELDYALLAGATGGDSSEATQQIRPNSPSKAVVAPNPLPSAVEPGEAVVFELVLDIPAGNTADVVLTDFLPRPVFDVGDFNAATDLEILAPFSGLTPGVTTRNADNSIRLDFGDITSPVSATLRVRLTARVVGEPFADGLFLTNLLSTSYRNSNGETIEALKAAGLTVGAPSLAITKGVLDAANPRAVITPPPPSDPADETADSDVRGVDASDEITFAITVENLGSTRAYNVTIDDPATPAYSCTAPTSGDLVDGDGATLAFSGSLGAGLVLASPLEGNDGSPGAPYSRDTAILTLRCTLTSDVEPRQTYSNEAGVVWTSIPDPAQPFTRVTDSAEAVIADPTISKRITNIAPGYASGNLRAHIGEIATYEVEIVVPEGRTSNVRLEDQVPSGLAFIDVLSVTPSSNALSTSITGGFDGIRQNSAGINAVGGGPTAPDRRLVFGPANNDPGFGTITNSDSDNSVAETITVTYRARVLNAAVNVSGQRRRNRARWFWQPDGSGRIRVEVRADALRIVESGLTLEKTFIPDDGDDSTPPEVVLVIRNGGGSDSDAFDVELADLLPLDMRVQGGVVDTSLCPFLPDTLNVMNELGRDRLNVSWDSFPNGETCTLRFQTEFVVSLPAGATRENCAEILWESLRDADQPLAQPPSNTLGFERTGVDNGDGEINDYRFQACDVFRVFGVGITKDVTSSNQPHTDSIPGTPSETESLTIGETVTFELVATAPEAPIDQLEIQDLLPVGANVLELLSARTTFVGADLSPTNADPAAVISDRDFDGINDRVTLDYGFVGRSIDGQTNDNDRIRIEVVAKVRDVVANRNNDITSNTGIARFLGGLQASGSYQLEIVEPILSFSKTADRSVAEAGDSVTFRLRIEHDVASRIDAKDLLLDDAIPPQLNLVGSPRLGAVCTNPPDSAPVVSGGAITARWATFPRDAICEIEFDVSVDVSAVVGQSIVNEGDIAWTSIEGSGDPDDRQYSLDDQWTLNISQPGITKDITATDVAETAFISTAAGTELTIGETATFTVVVDFPDGTTADAIVRDQLPQNGVALEITRAAIVSVGDDLSIENGQGPGSPGVDCSGPTPFQTCATWFLGDVVNAPDTRPTPDPADQLVFEIDALVLDNPLNSGAPGEDKNLQNTAILESLNLDLLDTSSFDLVEPQLTLQKLTENGSLPGVIAAAQTHRFTLVLRHLARSTASALGGVVTDTLDPDMRWVDSSNVISDCPGFGIASSPTDGDPGIVVFNFGPLPLATNSCEISYDVRGQNLLPVGETFRNSALLEWESAPGSPESRPGQDQDSAILVSLSNATISKVITSTSVPGTGSSIGDPDVPDVAIGERISYRIVAVFTEGRTNNVELIDTLDAADPNDPQLEPLGGGVLLLGGNIATSEPGNPDVNPPNQITVRYGDVDNSGDATLDQDDTIVLELNARASDIPANVSGVQRDNLVEFNFDSGLGSEMLTSMVSVEIVEPVLEVSKSFTDLTDGVATIEIVLRNSGNSPAYESGFSDEFDETFWLSGSLTPLSVPPGFELSETSSGGTTTVTLATEGDPTSAQEILEPGEAVTIEFSMELVDGGVVGVAQIDNTVNASTTSVPGTDDGEREYSASAMDSLFFPEATLEKRWTGANDPVLPGDVLTFELTLDNSSGLAPLTEVLLSDEPDSIGSIVPGSVTPSSGGTVLRGNLAGETLIEVSFDTVAAGATATVRYDVQVPTPYPDGRTAEEQLSNQATADSKELRSIRSDDPDEPGDEDPTVVDVLADPIMRVTKDDQVLGTGPGLLVRYRIDYANVGNQDATGVVLSERVPADTVFSAGDSSPGWTCADGSGPNTLCELAIGGVTVGQGTAFFAVRVDNPLDAGVTRIENRVDITDDGFEADPGDPVVPSTDSANEVTPIGGAFPQLEIDKNDGGISVAPGERYSYRIDYRNVGNQAATGVVITEVVPPDVVFSATASQPSRWSCPDGSPPGTACSFIVPLLAGGAADTANFGLDVVFPADVGRVQIDNTVRINDDGANSPQPQTDEASDDTPLIAAPNLNVNKTPDVGQTAPGQSIVYTITYANMGNRNASSSLIREVVPEGTIYSAAGSAPTNWNCADGAPAGTVCEVAGGALQVGDGGAFSFAVDVIDTPLDRVIVNNVLIELDAAGVDGDDPDLGDNSDSASTPLPVQAIDTMSRFALLLLALLVMATASRRLRTDGTG